MTSRSPWILALAFVWGAQLLAGCATYATNVEGGQEASLRDSEAVLGKLLPTGYQVERFPVSFELQSGLIAPDGNWLLANVQSTESGTFLSKVGDRFVQVLLLETNGQGVSDLKVHVPRYELYFRHAITGAALTFRAHAQSDWAKHLDLAVLAMERVDAESATLSTVVADGSGVALVNESDSRVAEYRGGTPTVVEELPAYAFEYLVRDGDRVRLGLPEQPIRVRTVFVRADFLWDLRQDRLSYSIERPVVLEFTLAARGVYFDELRGALDDLISRFRAQGPKLVPAADRDQIDRCLPADQQVEQISVSLRRGYASGSSALRVYGIALDGVSVTETALLDCLREPATRLGNSQFGTTTVRLRKPKSTAQGPAYSPAVWDGLAPTMGGSPAPPTP